MRIAVLPPPSQACGAFAIYTSHFNLFAGLSTEGMLIGALLLSVGLVGLVGSLQARFYASGKGSSKPAPRARSWWRLWASATGGNGSALLSAYLVGALTCFTLIILFSATVARETAVDCALASLDAKSDRIAQAADLFASDTARTLTSLITRVDEAEDVLSFQLKSASESAEENKLKQVRAHMHSESLVVVFYSAFRY